MTLTTAPNPGANLSKGMVPHVRRRPRSERRTVIAMLAPAGLVLAAVFLIPLLYSLWNSFQETGTAADEVAFVGTEHYQELLVDSDFWRSVRVSVVFTAGAVAGTYALGLVTALLVDRSVPGARVLQGASIVPWAMPYVAAALLWATIFDYQYGPANWLIQASGLTEGPVGWLTSPTLALATVTFVQIWSIFPLASCSTCRRRARSALSSCSSRSVSRSFTGALASEMLRTDMTETRPNPQPLRSPHRRRRNRAGTYLLRLAPVIALTVVILSPVYWMVVTALRENASLFSVPPKVLPVDIDPGVAARAVVETPILGWLANSTIVAGSSTMAAIVLGVPAGYALSRLVTKGSQVYSGWILVTQMLPPLLLLVPLFMVFQRVNLTDSLGGLILADTATVLPLTIWMSKAMIDAVPVELDQAAMIDGCSRFRALASVVLPVCRSGITSVAIYAFIVTWDEFLFAKTLLTTSSNWPAAVGLFTFQGQYVTPVNQVMFAALLFTLPPLILFFVARRGLVSGMTAGAVKG